MPPDRRTRVESSPRLFLSDAARPAARLSYPHMPQYSMRISAMIVIVANLVPGFGNAQ